MDNDSVREMFACEYDLDINDVSVEFIMSLPMNSENDTEIMHKFCVMLNLGNDEIKKFKFVYTCTEV